ncbi:hypothetical protein DM860_014816 [Cuscuta australis]|uniref:Uncharacterized protein n=1 Tax=Cuscuta australis TaxID=267555 RepID=A0A328D1U4_9ASTE|nr:hypothetical protein DM860_014816 [Cuscuta australis]
MEKHRSSSKVLRDSTWGTPRHILLRVFRRQAPYIVSGSFLFWRAGGFPFALYVALLPGCRLAADVLRLSFAASADRNVTG